MEGMKKGTRYGQLSYEERISIKTLLGQGASIRSIASALGRSPNTIAREVKEKQVKGDYQPKKAQHKTYWRRYRSKRDCMKVALDTELIDLVMEKLALRWSPERIAGYAQRRGIVVSAKAIYKFIRSRCLERYLFWHRNRRRGGPKRSVQQHRDTLKRGTALRPVVSGSGHLELDFIVSRQSAAVLLVTVDRYTRKTLIYRLPHKTHRAVLGVLREMKTRYLIKTITTDNDLVFRRWQELERVLGIPFFFTQPYHSWEKGLVENTNRWIRTFLPKKRDLATVTDVELHLILAFLNETPRQCLGFRTAVEVELEEMRVNYLS